MKNQTNNAKNVNAKANAPEIVTMKAGAGVQINYKGAKAAGSSVYTGMYAAIKQQAQTPSQVVKAFYSAAMNIEDGQYKEIFAELLGKSKNDFCQTYCKKVVEAFGKQTRCKRYTLFFVWSIVYKDIKPIIEGIKRHADYNKNIESLQKEAKAVEALEKAAKAAK